MRNNQDTMFFEYIKQRRGRKAWQKVVSALICVVVFCTTYALILPAITQERDTFCGFEAHTHEDACYAAAEATVLTELVCQLAEGEPHAHGESCYLPAHSHAEECWLPVHSHTEECHTVSEPTLICTLEEIEAHTHGETCYAAQTPLICETAESEGHAHSDSCYSEKVTTLICTEEESETHTHGDVCYTTTGGELICTTEESAGHTHEEGCYGEAQTVQTCTLEETGGHAHTDACYTPGETVLTCTLGERTEPELNCGLEERAEAELNCGLEETEGHTHEESCYETVEAVLTCGQEETEEHTHGQACYGTAEPVLACELEEHTHELICYSDVTADVETAAEWEATFAGAEMTGVWSEDLLTIAATQIGYQESTANYIVLDDGETIHGYTRYGHWYGDHYGDWCAMFVSFCLHYAGVEDMPLDANCQSWINALTEAGLYTAAAEAEPKPGDLVFFDYESDGISDHVGVVETVTEEAITTIEGNSANRVQRVTYDRSSATICGYGHLPYQLSEAEQEAVDRVIAMIDAIPSADEIDAKIAEFEEAEDYDGEEAWLTETYQQVAEAYTYYNLLSTVQKQRVTNADKLMELEYIWSVTPLAVTSDRPTIYQINSYVDSSNGDAVMVFGGTVSEKVTWGFVDWYAIKVEKDANGDLRVVDIQQPGVNKLDYRANDTGFVLLFYRYEVIPDAAVGDYVTVHFTILPSGDWKSDGYGTVSFSEAKSGIHSDTPTKIDSASTSEFVELNLFDYNGNINANYWTTNNWYPGFQWNGGAYSNDSGDSDNNDYRYTYTQIGIGIPYAVTDRNVIDSIDFGNSLITNLRYGYGSNGDYTKAINATAVGFADKTKTHPINWLYGNSTEGYTNKPIGYSTTDLTESQNVMKYTLVEGYPALTDGTMLDYLFKDDTAKGTASAVTQLNTESIDGLFLYDEESGAYTFNSRENHAEYVAGENRFQLYDEIITPNFITYPFGNFLPLNTIDDSSKATQVGAFNYPGGMRNYAERLIADLKNDAEGLGDYWSSSQTQLATMLEEYKENWTLYGRTINDVKNTWENLSPANAIRDYFWGDTNGGGDKPSNATDFITQDFLDNMYNIDWDVQTNFFFGMEMKMSFYQPKDGMTGKDKDGDGEFDYPMEFNFTGDDDVWVYIDDVLFLDLSGIHRHVGGQIDFVNGLVHYYDLQPSTTGDVSGTAYTTFTFEEILTAAGASTEGLNDKGTFENYTTHSFKFYYMERGSGSSVCRMNFNFPLLRQNTLAVEKELADDDSTEAIEALGNPDFLFQVLDADDNSPFVPAGWAYSLYDVDGSVIQEIKVNSKYPDGRVEEMQILDASGNVLCTEKYDSDGKMTGWTGDGQDQVVRVGDNGVFALKAGQKAEFIGIPESRGKYYVRELLEETVVGQYGQITVSGTAADMESVTVGGISYTGAESPVLDMTNGSSTFRIENKITTANLGTLNISKKLTEYSEARDVKYYDIQVKLDGELLPVGTEYTVGGETRTVTTAGIVTIAADETATISNILAGTAFEVQETSGSAEGYTVTYTEDGGYTVTVNDGVVSGVIKTSANVQLVVTNSEKGATVTIPGTKSLLNPDGAEHTYTFRLDEVTDSTGATVKEGGIENYTANATVKDAASSFSFTINYIQVEQMSLPAAYYYRITELANDDSITNDTVYVAEVTVSKTDDGIAAAVTGMWKDGTKIETLSADFANTLAGSLTLSKSVDGSTTDSQFEFTIKLDPGEPGEVTYPVILNHAGSEEPQTSAIKFTDGVTIVRMTHGESLTIQDIPYGTTWTIEEAKSEGYIVKTAVTVGDTTTAGEGLTTTGSITTGTTQVVYTNVQTYVLPETGGAGVIPYTMAGLGLMTGAGCLMYNQRKRRKGGKFA